MVVDGKRVAYLTCVDAIKNCNKYYQITENNDGSCDVEYDRVGATNPHKKHYERYEKSFDELFRTRLSHGYKDETNGHYISVSKETFKEEEYEETQTELDYLYKMSRQFAQKYYSNPSAITKKQFEETVKSFEKIKEIYDRVSNLSVSERQKELGLSRSAINERLISMFTDAPRKMSNVSDYLLNISSDYYSDLETIINRESELLANLEIVVNQPMAIEKKNEVTLSESFGINMRPCTYKEEDEIKKLLHYKYEGSESWKKAQYENDNSERLIRLYKVENKQTHEAFEKCVKDMNIKEKDCHLLFHGSGSENFLSIMSKGLILNADSKGLASTTGKGLGYGLYFADDSAKALNYAGGGTKYIALFNVAVGKPFKTDVYFGDTGGITVDGKHLTRGMGFKDLPKDTQSVYFKGSSYRPRHEICIYKQEQCDIQYLLVCEPYRRKDVRFSLKLDVPFKDLEKDGNIYKATVELSDYCKEQLSKIYTKGEIEKVRGEYDIENNHFSIYINRDRTPTVLTNDEQERLGRCFKKSFFESEHDFKKDVKAYKEKDKEKEVER